MAASIAIDEAVDCVVMSSSSSSSSECSETLQLVSNAAADSLVANDNDNNQPQWQVVNNVLVAKSALLSPAPIISEYNETDVCEEVVVGHDHLTMQVIGEDGEVIVMEDLHPQSEFPSDLSLGCSDSHECDLDGNIPEVVAVETVTSSHPCDDHVNNALGSPKLSASVQIVGVPATDPYVINKVRQKHVRGQIEVVEAINPGGQQVCQLGQAMSKKERERLVKRELRKDPDFKARERIQGRTRMQDLRRNPAYRERERQKDRERRRLSRQTNMELRTRERERDRNHKRIQKLQASEGDAIVMSDGLVVFPVGVVVGEDEACEPLDTLDMYNSSEHEITPS